MLKASNVGPAKAAGHTRGTQKWTLWQIKEAWYDKVSAIVMISGSLRQQNSVPQMDVPKKSG